jgi:hypothetical protein
MIGRPYAAGVSDRVEILQGAGGAGSMVRATSSCHVINFVKRKKRGFYMRVDDVASNIREGLSRTLSCDAIKLSERGFKRVSMTWRATRFKP